MNVQLTFEKGLKLYFSLGQLPDKLNTYKRSTKAGRRAAANLCIYPHKLRITVNEGRLKRPATSTLSETADKTEPEVVEEEI